MNVLIQNFIYFRMYEDDFELEDHELVSGRANPTLNESKTKNRASASSPEDDIYNFSTKDLGY